MTTPGNVSPVIVNRLRAVRAKVEGCMAHLSECQALDRGQCDCGYESALNELGAITQELDRGLREIMDAARAAQDATLMKHHGSAQEAMGRCIVALQKLGGAA